MANLNVACLWIAAASAIVGASIGFAVFAIVAIGTRRLQHYLGHASELSPNLGDERGQAAAI